MRMRLLAVILPLFVVTAVAVAGYFYWLHEEPRATGSLAEALLARVDPDEGEQNLDEVANAFFGDQAPIAERRAILETNGFDCVISPANVAGSEILSCRRPIEGRHYCDRFNIYVYQTAAGEIVESLVSTYRVSQQDKILGRCPYNPPRADG